MISGDIQVTVDVELQSVVNEINQDRKLEFIQELLDDEEDLKLELLKWLLDKIVPHLKEKSSG